jgi:hypothetical protein
MCAQVATQRGRQREVGATPQGARASVKIGPDCPNVIIVAIFDPGVDEVQVAGGVVTTSGESVHRKIPVIAEANTERGPSAGNGVRNDSDFVWFRVGDDCEIDSPTHKVVGPVRLQKVDLIGNSIGLPDPMLNVARPAWLTIRPWNIGTYLTGWYRRRPRSSLLKHNDI